MPSRLEPRALILAVLLGTASLRAAPPPVDPEVHRAAQVLRDDPNIERGGVTRQLRWVERPSPRSEPPGWLSSAANLINVSGRMLLWGAAVVAAAFLVVYLVRLGQLRAARAREGFVSPTHVQDLDIRPESLPEDVAAAAWALWERGECRAALSLLYRGMLSRLVHVHRTPIRASSTEEECAQLAAARLSDPQVDYVRQLIQVWQDAVYGGRNPPTEHFQALCGQLEPQLAGPRGAA